MKYHVSKNGKDSNSGTEEYPFLTISKASEVMVPGDSVTVHEGIYRELVRPMRGGVSDSERIVYEVARGEHAVITGSEIVNGWELVDKTVWKLEVPNCFFGDFNPFAERLGGDWFHKPVEYDVHRGELFLNGKSLFEAKSIDDVYSPEVRRRGWPASWSRHIEYVRDPEWSVYVWRAEVSSDYTTIYANFHEYDPNDEVTEISVRPFCFFPEKTGINYITVDGFEICNAATQWNPPTSFQSGAIGPHWAKGWIIQNCDIHDAKTSGVSLGRDSSTGQNQSSTTGRKSGYIYQFETIMKVLRNGWSKEKLGSHIIRNNRIHDCGENGIVGNLGAIFSQIIDNDIYNIAIKHEFVGAEIAGIKLHSALDVEIIGNRISDCTLGTWLDWELQGARISRNLYYRNDRDLFLEVSHGPYIVDDNIFMSDYTLDNISQGGAYLHNIFAGQIRREPVLDRSTPYHFAHSTDVAGTSFVYSGDDRFFNNIFLGRAEICTNATCGTVGYNGHMDDADKYLEMMKADRRDHSKYFEIKQPVFINGNMYLDGAESYDLEKDNIHVPGASELSVTEESDGFYLDVDIKSESELPRYRIYSTSDLRSPRIVECPFEDRDGNEITFDVDFLGNKRVTNTVPGPVDNLKVGHNRFFLRRK